MLCKDGYILTDELSTSDKEVMLTSSHFFIHAKSFSDFNEKKKKDLHTTDGIFIFKTTILLFYVTNWFKSDEG